MRVLVITLLLSTLATPAVTIVGSKNASARERLGMERLRAALDSVPGIRNQNASIRARVTNTGVAEAFRLRRSGNTILVEGGDASGGAPCKPASWKWNVGQTLSLRRPRRPPIAACVASTSRRKISKGSGLPGQFER